MTMAVATAMARDREIDCPGIVSRSIQTDRLNATVQLSACAVGVTKRDRLPGGFWLAHHGGPAEIGAIRARSQCAIAAVRLERYSTHIWSKRTKPVGLNW